MINFIIYKKKKREKERETDRINFSKYNQNEYLHRF